MSSQLLAFELSKPVDATPPDEVWRGESVALAGWYCTNYSCCAAECEIGYFGGTSLTCKEWGIAWNFYRCDQTA